VACDSGPLLAWFVIGLVTGSLVSIGALLGGVLFGPVLPGNTGTWIGAIVVMVIGAGGLYGGLRAAAPRRHRPLAG
jgi:hypothetical protein